MVCPGIAVPPVGTVYHLYCPELPPEALTVTAEGPQATLLVVDGAAGIELMVATASVLVLSQVPLLMLT